MAQDGLFYNPFNAAYRRTWKQAIVWYVIFFVIGVAFSGLMGGIFGALGLTAGAQDFALSQLSGQLTIILYVLVLGFALIFYRPKCAINLLLVGGGVVMAIALGALGGLLPLAYLTTRSISEP